jgi:K+ transporter
VSIKYVTFILRADNDGEGGIMALAALVQRASANRCINSAVLVALGVFGASLFYGDSAITPAISVLSAVEGLKVAAPDLAHLVVPIALAILTALFTIQRWGTQAIGRLFGPVMVLWFISIGLAGEATFFAANLSKIHHGGWLPLAIGAGVFTVMTTWNRGREIVSANRDSEEGPLRRFVDELHELAPPLPRVPGTAVFLSPSNETTPLAM